MYVSFFWCCFFFFFFFCSMITNPFFFCCLPLRDSGQIGCWLCSQPYVAGHYADINSTCNGLQFCNADTLEEALAAKGVSSGRIEEIVGNLEQQRVLTEERMARDRRQRARRACFKIVLYILFSPIILVLFLLALPFLGAQMLVSPF
jgi:hypothetical protein